MRQFTERVATLVMNGHPPDKIELLVLGGTWTSYPHAYQEEFCRDLFFAANTFGTRREQQLRPRRSLEEEQARTLTLTLALTLALALTLVLILTLTPTPTLT